MIKIDCFDFDFFNIFSFVLTLSKPNYLLSTKKGLKPCSYKALPPMAIPCASLHFPSSPRLHKTSFSSQFTPLLSPSHLFLTVCSRHTPTKSTNARNSNYTTNMGIAYLNYPVVVKAQTSSSSALSREPMLPPFNVLITGSTKRSFFSWFSNYCLISLWCLLCCVYCCGFWFGFAC